MFLIIKEDKAHDIETKIHKMKACLGEIVDCLHEAKRISYMPEEYRSAGYNTHSERRHEIEDRRRMEYDDPYYPPRDSYDIGRDFDDRGRGGRYR